MNPTRKALMVLAAAACAAGAGCGDDVSDDRPDADVQSGGFLDEAVIARVAVVLNSCLSDDGFLRTQTHLRGDAGGYAYPGGATLIGCLAEVSDGCAGVRACFGLSDPESSDVCDTCMGNVAVICGDGMFRWDCDAIDATCRAGRCIAAGEQTCDEQTAELPSCDEQGRPLHCDDVIQRGASCLSFGLECDPQAGYVGACRGTGEACTPRESEFSIDYYAGTACDGDTLTACLGGRVGQLDCTRFGAGFGCRQAGGAFFCGAAGDCDALDFEPTCEGTRRVFCNAGKIERVDCTALGFSACGERACVDA